MKSYTKISKIILTVYLCLIFIAFIDVFVTQNIWIILAAAAVFAALSYLGSGFIFNRISAIKTDPLGSVTSKTRFIVFTVSAMVAFAVMMVWFAGYRPGSFQGDCMAQLHQALKGSYNDWHPIWHTLLVYTLPLKLTGGKLWSMVFFQMAIFSLSVGYMGMTVYSCAGRGWMIVSLCYVLLNPFTGQMMLYPWKDSAFAIAGLICMTMLCRIILTQNEPAIWYLILLGFMLANTAIFRHNGIIFSLPLLLILIPRINIRKWLIVAAGFILSMFLIKVPLYGILDTYDRPQTTVQAVGLPMNIIANVAKEDPGSMDTETSDFIYSIAPSDVWENDYELGNFGVIKYYSDINEQSIDDKGVLPIMKMAGRCFIHSPGASFRAFFATTDIVYGPDINDEGYIGAHIDDNSDGLAPSGSPAIASLLDTYYKLFRLHGYNYLRQSAFSLLLMLIIALAKCDLTTKNGWLRILPIIPVFMYSFGSMLLLTSPDSRFFFIGYLICPVCCISLLSGSGKETI